MMKFRNPALNNEGVSPVIGMILIISMVTISVGIIYISGIPFINSAKYNAQMLNVKNSFTVLHNDILEVNNGPVAGAGIGRISKIDLAGGSIFVHPNNTEIQIDYTFGGKSDNVAAVPGTITYQLQSQSVIYENGAVITNYIGKSYMEIEPQIYASDLGSGNIGLMVHIINNTALNSSIGGTSTGKIRTLISEYGYSEFSGDVDCVNITIHSQNWDAWGRYFNETLTDAGLESGTQFNVDSPADDTVRIDIKGAKGTGDIHLSIFETKIYSTAE